MADLFAQLQHSIICLSYLGANKNILVSEKRRGQFDGYMRIVPVNRAVCAVLFYECEDRHNFTTNTPSHQRSQYSRIKHKNNRNSNAILIAIKLHNHPHEEMSIRTPPATSAGVAGFRWTPHQTNDAYVTGVWLSIFGFYARVYPGFKMGKGRMDGDMRWMEEGRDEDDLVWGYICFFGLHLAIYIVSLFLWRDEIWLYFGARWIGDSTIWDEGGEFGKARYGIG